MDNVNTHLNPINSRKAIANFRTQTALRTLEAFDATALADACRSVFARFSSEVKSSGAAFVNVFAEFNEDRTERFGFQAQNEKL